MAFILSVYGLPAAALTTFILALKDAILAAMVAAYQRCASIVSISPDWTPSQTDVNTAMQAAQDHAQSVVQTYQNELTNVVQGFAESYKAANNGSLDGILGPMGDMLADWSTTRTAYKAEQVAGYECGLGAEQGFQAFVVDLASGALIDPQTGEVLSGGDYAIAVLPAESSHDECRDYAGLTFDITDADELPEFPLHGGCPHYKTLVTL